MLLLPIPTPTRIAEGICHIDRKLHTGASLYADSLDLEVVCLAPTLKAGDMRMDFIEIPVDYMKFRVKTVDCNARGRPCAHERQRVEALVRQSRIVYGRALGVAALARKHRVPYIPIIEYNLRSNLSIARLNAPGRLRGLLRQMRALGEFIHEVRDIARSHSVHCNGYPSYRQSRFFHGDCLLYLDSRISTSDVISAEALEARVASLRQGRRPKLLYSGRYTAMKGALDAVRVGIELRRLGVDFELHTYGRGDLSESMRATVASEQASGQITVHDALPYPELVQLTPNSDLFVCCHVQDDPSCTYLETLGAGVPIVGYANAMWKHLAAESGAGIATTMGDVKKCAQTIAELLKNQDRLRQLSERARLFAATHTFEQQFERRIARLRAFSV